MSKKLLTSILCMLAAGAMSAPSALALQNLREEKAGATVPVGTNFVVENEGKATLVAGTLTITCNESDIGGTVTTAANEPAAELQSVVFGGCSEGSGNRVVVRTRTTTPWKLKWTAANTFSLTGISAELEVGALKCTVSNKVGSTFSLTWKNDPDGFELAELEASKQALTVAGTGCPTEGSETVTYKFEAEGIGDKTSKFWLE